MTRERHRTEYLLQIMFLQPTEVCYSSGVLSSPLCQLSLSKWWEGEKRESKKLLSMLHVSSEVEHRIIDSFGKMQRQPRGRGLAERSLSTNWYFLLSNTLVIVDERAHSKLEPNHKITNSRNSKSD